MHVSSICRVDTYSLSGSFILHRRIFWDVDLQTRTGRKRFSWIHSRLLCRRPSSSSCSSSSCSSQPNLPSSEAFEASPSRHLNTWNSPQSSCRCFSFFVSRPAFFLQGCFASAQIVQSAFYLSIYPRTLLNLAPGFLLLSPPSKPTASLLPFLFFCSPPKARRPIDLPALLLLYSTLRVYGNYFTRRTFNRFPYVCVCSPLAIVLNPNRSTSILPPESNHHLHRTEITLNRVNSHNHSPQPPPTSTNTTTTTTTLNPQPSTPTTLPLRFTQQFFLIYHRQTRQ
jgi:hypothetical protein